MTEETTPLEQEAAEAARQLHPRLIDLIEGMPVVAVAAAMGAALGVSVDDPDDLPAIILTFSLNFTKFHDLCNDKPTIN